MYVYLFKTNSILLKYITNLLDIEEQLTKYKILNSFLIASEIFETLALMVTC